VSPILSGEERMRLITHGHSCRSSAECEPPLGCLVPALKEEGVCVDSGCLTDWQCDEGWVCRTFRTEGEGPWVRRCTVPGIRQEGELCWEARSNKGMTCARGLACNAGWCGRPCRLDERETGCPAGFSCREGLEGPSCVPACEGRTCPQGQQCVLHGGGASACMKVHGVDCARTSCAEGRRCATFNLSMRDGELEIWRECVPACEGGRACPEGMECRGDICWQSCTPGGAASCREGYQCVPLEADGGTGLCHPE
jgi:hypothetical protein